MQGTVVADQELIQWRRLAGIAVFTYLTAAIYKCNEVIKKEVALKGESSRFMVTVLGTIAAVQALSFLIVLYRQELWLNFIMVPREGSVKGVRVLTLPRHVNAMVRRREWPVRLLCGFSARVSDACFRIA